MGLNAIIEHQKDTTHLKKYDSSYNLVAPFVCTSKNYFILLQLPTKNALS